MNISFILHSSFVLNNFEFLSFVFLPFVLFSLTKCLKKSTEGAFCQTSGPNVPISVLSDARVFHVLFGPNLLLPLANKRRRKAPRILDLARSIKLHRYC